jgi:hypothetical protein
VKPLSLLKFFCLSLIWMTSLTGQSMYPDALSNTEMLLKSMLCPVLMLCSATADFCGWSSYTCLICSLHLASTDLPVWPIYTFRCSQGIIQYTPRILRPKSSWQSWAIACFSFLVHELSWYCILLGVYWFCWTWFVGMVALLYLPVYYSSVQASVWDVVLIWFHSCCIRFFERCLSNVVFSFLRLSGSQRFSTLD